MEREPDETITQRIGAALARVEAALRSASPAGNQAHQTLETRHARLREGVVQALAEIDGLIGDLAAGDLAVDGASPASIQP